MNKALLLLCPLALAATGCMTPRSAVFGQGGALLARNGVETTVSPGMMFQVQNAPPQNFGGGSSAVASSTSVSVPAFEANTAFGLSDAVGLNFHFSPAGLQPGVKVALSRGAFSLAVLPEVALGLVSVTSNTFANGVPQGTPSNQSTLSLLAGFKLLGSHESGFYGGFGYDFQTFSVATAENPISGINTPSVLGSSSHNLALAVGYEIRLAGLKLRPELAMLFSPALSSSSASGNTTVSQTGGSLALFFPNLSIAVDSSREQFSAPPLP